MPPEAAVFYLLGEFCGLKPSVDRIDSAGHYEHGNLQIVCRFVNRWKTDTENEEFKRLLMLVRGDDSVYGRSDDCIGDNRRNVEAIAMELNDQVSL